MAQTRGRGGALSWGGRIFVTASVLALEVLWTPIAVGQAQPNDAREHYRRGTAAYNLGKYAEAAHEYESAYEATLDPALLFNVAQAYRLAGDRRKALTAYRSYVRSAPDGDKREVAEARIKEIETAFDYEDPFAAENVKPVKADAPTTVAVPELAKSLAPAPAPPETVAPTRRLVMESPPEEAQSTVAIMRVEHAAASQAAKPPIYKRWWFWAAGAAVVVGIAVILVAASGSSGSTPPQTDLGTMRF